MSDGDACGPACGWCGRCTHGYETVERTCAKCGASFEQSLDGPYQLRVWCHRCVHDAQAVKNDAIYTQAVDRWFRKQSA